MTGGRTIGGVRASTPLAIIGETSRATMTPNRPPCSNLDAHVAPARTNARTVGRVASVSRFAGEMITPVHSGGDARMSDARTPTE